MKLKNTFKYGLPITLMLIGLIFSGLPKSLLANFGVLFTATSTSQGWIFPSKVNGSEQSVVAVNFIATSTTNSVFPNFVSTNSTSTNATTTSLYVSSIASTTQIRANTGNIGNLTVTSCTGCFTPTFTFPFTTLGTGQNATSTTLAFLNGFISTASSTFTSTALHLASTTLQAFTANQATTSEATTTSLYVSSIASTTQIRANTGNIGNLTVTSCTGCSGSGVTLYVATSTTNRYMAKTLALSSGDVVTWWGSGVGNNCGVMAYRISSPQQNSSTTVFSDGSCADDPRGIGPFAFLATTTETVTFDWIAGNSGFSGMTLLLQSNAYANVF